MPQSEPGVAPSFRSSSTIPYVSPANPHSSLDGAGASAYWPCWFVAVGRHCVSAVTTDITGIERVACLQLFFHETGIWAPAVYVLLVTIEVIVAPIPGVLLYAPGGLIFGPWLGGLLALIGNMMGSGISCGLTAFSTSGRSYCGQC